MPASRRSGISSKRPQRTAHNSCRDPHGVFRPGEVCDPVEDDQYGYQIDGILVTDFITPDWFAHQHSHGNIDFKGHARAAFEVLSGGYAQKWDPHRGWQQVTGSKATHSQRATAPRGSRRDRRARQWQNWERSFARVKLLQ